MATVKEYTLVKSPAGDDGETFLSWRPPAGNWQGTCLEVLKDEKIGTLGLDLGDAACLLLAMADRYFRMAPAWDLAQAAQAVRAPAKVRAVRDRFRRWLLEHWHQPGVRNAMAASLRPCAMLPALAGKHVDLSRMEVECRSVSWLQLAWSAAQSRAPGATDAARDAFGAADWDSFMQALRTEVQPALQYLLLRPVIERAANAATLKQKLLEVSEQASTVENKHAKATGHIRQLQQRVSQLEAELADAGRRIRDLEAQLAEERATWSELLATAQAQGLQAPPSLPSMALPLAGKRVIILGGDPIAAGAQAVIEDLGGEPVFCSGVEKEARVPGAASGADLAVIVTPFVTHKHKNELRAALGKQVPVVYVNSLGITAFRRVRSQVKVHHRAHPKVHHPEARIRVWCFQFGFQEAASCAAAGSRGFLLLAAQALPETVALAVHGQDVRPVGQSVKQGCREPLVAEYTRPF